MSLKRWVLLPLLALGAWGGWWFFSRVLELAKDTADESHARAYIKQIAEAQKLYLSDNPTEGFACGLDDLRRAGLPSPPENQYIFELHCDNRKKTPEAEYWAVAYPADKRIKGAWGFSLVCSDQTGEIWGGLSREHVRDSPSESEKAGLYDFEAICRRSHRPSH
jgi:hypothetical protein